MNNELSINELDTVSGGDNFKAYAEINVLGFTIAIAETKGGLVEGQVFSGNKTVGSTQYGK